MKTDYDIIIAGAGASGLSLLWRLINHPKLCRCSVLLIDRKFEWHTSKTWCFWNAPDKIIAPFVDHKWDYIKVKTAQGTVHHTENHPYYRIDSTGFRTNILARARAFESVTLVETDIKGFKQATNNSKATIVTSRGEFVAEHIFQSVVFGETTQSRQSLEQVFKGTYIQTKNPVFDPLTITLMDFSTGPHFPGKTAFFYVLPFTETTALIESTLFTSQHIPSVELTHSIRWYLSNTFGLDDKAYRITNDEQGVIPMNPHFTPPDFGNGIVNIGSTSGATKPSTGYTFERTQIHLQNIISALESNRQPPPFRESSFRFKFYDDLLTSILIENPDLGPVIFHKLFARHSIERVLSFLDEDTSLFTEAHIFSRLPWSPFLKAALNYISTRFMYET